jgi:DNA-binding response OmpR family regulator
MNDAPLDSSGCDGVSRHAGQRAARVLVVQDYLPLCKSISQGLREAGYALDAATDGDVVLGCLVELLTAIVLDQSGEAFVHQVREVDSLPRLA